jgi:hypothetical protein
MNIFRKATFGMIASFLFAQNALATQDDLPEFFSNTWHVYSCLTVPSGTSEKAARCEDEADADKRLVKGSFIHITPIDDKSVHLAMKLAGDPDLQVFDGTIEWLEEEADQPGVAIRFEDDADPQRKPETKWLSLRVIRTEVKNDFGNRDCEAWLDHLLGKTTNPPDKTVCRRNSNGKHRNAVYWRIDKSQPAPPSTKGAERMMMPPGDGQGSGSEGPPP